MLRIGFRFHVLDSVFDCGARQQAGSGTQSRPVVLRDERRQVYENLELAAWAVDDAATVGPDAADTA
jgi:hypothetical protein